MLIGAAPAVAGDDRALRAALCCAADPFLVAGDDFRISLRLEIEAEAPESVVLRLPPLLAETRVDAARLDLILDAGELASAGARASRIVAPLQALGVGLSLDLGTDIAIDRAAALFRVGEGAGATIWPDAIRLTCAGAEDVHRMRALRVLFEKTPESAPVLLADGVPSTGLLSQLRKAGASRGQGACFGAPFALRELELLLAARSDAASGAIEAARA
jgi:EAL domain-containing protein (putative c-di-GMP-specific phosphodiesterase class I)